MSVFDLIMAKVGAVEKENFYDKLVGYIQNDNPDGYPRGVYKNSDDAELLSKNYKNASELAGVLSNDGDISKLYINVFLNVLSMYITQKNKEKAFDVNCIKQENILELDAVKIKDNAELVCRAIDRALFFFQTRCGVRTIADINYQAQLAVIAYFFTDDAIFNNKKSHMLFEYWYWISIFSYLYPSSQNIKIFEEVPKFEAYFYGENNKDILNYLYKFQSDVLNKSDYSDEMTLKMKNSKKYPLPVITKYICQYYLSIGYKDFCTEKKLDFLYEGEFDIHHIMPLGSSPEYKDQRLKIGESTRKLRNKKDNPYNSPLNMIYITKESNKLISNMDYEDYSQNSHVKMVLPLVDCPSVISSGFSLDDFLSQRFNGLKTKLTSRLDELYACLNK